MDHMDLNAAKAKLEYLRKGCCHPQILDRSLQHGGNNPHVSSSRGSSGRGSGRGGGGTTGHHHRLLMEPRPLDQIMIMKVENTRQLCEEAQRQLLFHLFSLAGTIRLQGQCEELQMLSSSSTSFEDREQVHRLIHSDGDLHVVDDDDRGDRGDRGRQLYQCFYALKALHIYLLSIHLIKNNRTTTGLIAMLKMSGDDSLRNHGLMLPHGPEGFHLCWSVDDDIVANVDDDVVEAMDDNVVILMDSAGDTCIDMNCRDVSTNHQWSYSSLVTVSLYDDLQRSLLDKLSVIQSRFFAINKSVQLQFSHSKRLTAVYMQDNIHSYLTDYCFNASTTTTTNGSSSSNTHATTTSTGGDILNSTVIDSSNNKTDKKEAYVVFLMPAVIHLQVAMGNSDVFIDTETISIQPHCISNPYCYNSTHMDTDNSRCDGRKVGNHSSTSNDKPTLLYSQMSHLSSSHRAKRWRIRVSRIHPYFLVCCRGHCTTAIGSINHININDYTKCSVDTISKSTNELSYQWMDSTSLIQLKKSMSPSASIDTILSFTCRFSEATFDVDALQVRNL